jgi:hypothetical protein
MVEDNCLLLGLHATRVYAPGAWTIVFARVGRLTVADWMILLQIHHACNIAIAIS